MRTKECKKYQVVVDPGDDKCLTLKGKELWPDDDYVTDDKSMGEIIINAANYHACKSNTTWSYFDRVLWVEPRHPNPK